MDIFWLEAVVRELDGTVTDTRINKIHQPTADTLILKLWTGRETLRLLLSVDSRFSRLHLTERDYPNPFTPPRFCQLLRSRLSALTAVRQVPHERIVEFSFRGRDGDYLLMAELTGRHANLILADSDGRIVDALKRVDGGTDYRTIKPGRKYQFPERRKLIDLRQTLPDIPLNVAAAEDFKKWLLAELTPMSRAEAGQLALAVEKGRDCREVLDRFREQLMSFDYRPRIVEGGQGEELKLFPAEEENAEVRRFVTISEALDNYYYPQQFEAGQIGDGRELADLVRREIKKLRKRQEKIRAEEEEKSDFDERRQWGDLLLANLHLVKKGMESVEVTDYGEQPPVQVTIKLDPKLSPQENAEACFKRYKKEKRGLGHVSRRLQETAEELAWLEGLQLALDEADSPEELQEIRRELVDAEFIRPLRTDRVHRKTPSAAGNFHRATSPSGLSILWGRNNRSNDEISTRQTAKDDLWFHAHNQPGCHLVLKRGDLKGDFPQQDVLFAASLAAGYCRGRRDGKVEVMVAEGKAVQKPKGVRPGLVSVNSYRTVVVKPQRLEDKAPE